MTRVKRIPLLALFFVSAMEFILERALIDLALMTGALTILLWSRDQSGGDQKTIHNLVNNCSRAKEESSQ
jgi:hypothetical protein